MYIPETVKVKNLIPPTRWTAQLPVMLMLFCFCSFVTQEYMMTCLLCGTAADSVSILPDDPAKSTNIF